VILEGGRSGKRKSLRRGHLGKLHKKKEFESVLEHWGGPFRKKGLGRKSTQGGSGGIGVGPHPTK